MSQAASPGPERASLLTIPAEVRNQIYLYALIWNSHSRSTLPRPSRPSQPDALASALNPDHRNPPTHPSPPTPASSLALLQTCKQIHSEAHLFAFSTIPFHLHGDSTYPDVFDLRSRILSPPKLRAIRSLTITARISHLRALNEAWAGQPFGHPCLSLDTLTMIPRRAEVHANPYAEIADLSQSHTLAYIFSETLKGLRRVKCLEVRNEGCFNEVVWRLFYRSLVYRMWRWGGGKCGIRFESGEARPEGTLLEENRWFRAYMSGGEEVRGFECGDEVMRLVGSEGDLWP